MKDIPSSLHYMLMKEEACETKKDNMNDYVTLLIHSHYIILERQEQF